MKATAIAHPNIALIKYWGKRNLEFNLPTKTSFAVIMAELTTKTTIDFSEKYEENEIFFGEDKLTNTREIRRIVTHVDLIKEYTKETVPKTTHMKMVSQSNFPFGTGLAASSSIFASITKATIDALEIELPTKKLTILSRRGSGSATRSIYSGFNIWYKGNREDGTDSFAEQFAKPEYWPEFRMIVLITTSQLKKTPSREGMIRASATSPFYQEWLKESKDDLEKLKDAILKKKFKKVGEIAERNCLQMHSTAFTASPPIIYWNDSTLEIMHKTFELREKGVPCYFTIDAGPQVVLLSEKRYVKEILTELESLESIQRIVVNPPGEGVKSSKKHLF